ncbi:hypothetical protein [Rhizobium sp. 21-4511-3d]
MSFDAAKTAMTEALAKKPETPDEWAKVIKAAEDLLRSAGVSK